jgi:threonine synthase
MADIACQRCISPDCAATFGVEEILFACRRCGSLLDVVYEWSKAAVPKSLALFESRWSTPGRSPQARADFSGVWRFRELLPYATLEDLVSVGEGRTLLQQADGLAHKIGMKPGRLFLQYEGFNPSGSFKDNGMAAAFTMARLLGRAHVACASTGNTSASLALFARQTESRQGIPMRAIVFVGGGKIAYGKLAQALDYGARTIQIEGDFDACMRLVQQAADRLGLYLMNSVNPFRLEGQKTIMYRVLEGLGWEVPDWIIVPGGNLGNSSAFGKAFAELRELNLVDRVPRLAIINAAGANALYELVNEHGLRFQGGRIDRNRLDAYYHQAAGAGRSARTVASAIEIGRPVNLPKALRSLELMSGVVRQVSDDEILDGKALVGTFGYGCEPASGASVAGLRLLLAEKTISPSDRVVCILTGHALKDPDVTVRYHSQHDSGDRGNESANCPLKCPADIEAIARLLASET